MDLALLEAELIRDEGTRLHPYVDSVGKVTIGVGRNLTDVGISVDESALLLAHDIEDACHDLDVHLPWWRNLDEVRQRVMVNMCFNLGIGKLLGFPNTLSLIEAGKYAEAAVALKTSLWHRQVGPRAVRLEAMLETGAVT